MAMSLDFVVRANQLPIFPASGIPTKYNIGVFQDEQ
jgi:hypothetical protein